MSVMTGPRVTVEGASYTITPRVRSTARRLAFWIGALLFILLVGLITLGVAGTGTAGTKLSGTNAAANGSKALIQVLRQNGVTVSTPRSLDRAVADATKGTWGTTTIAIYDPESILAGTQIAPLPDLARNIVLIEPSRDALAELAPEIHQAGYANDSLKADCSFPPVRQAGTVTGSGVGYRLAAGTEGAVSCLGSGDDVHSLIRVTNAAGTVTAFGAGSTLTNQAIASDGNAALALGLFGQTTHLVWYLPSIADAPPTSSDIATPGWVVLTGVLCLAIVLAAAVWRGRRFGPLVLEKLPVIVRASETMEGRARLYQKASSRTHALDALRIGAIGRLATLCGLPRLANLDEVIGAVALATGRHPSELRALLVDDLPTSDSQLLRLSDELLVLEREVQTRTRPS
jgi:hypothetical protein